MQALFSPDSKLMQYLGRLGDLMMLNFFFLLTCIPVFTIGAAVTAMYTVCFRYDTDREEGTVKSYFEAFRANFRKATLLWLIALPCLLTAAFNTLAFYVMPGALRYAFFLFAFLLTIAVVIVSYAFPLLSQFENTIAGTLRNALLMGIGFLPRTILIVAVNVAPWALLLTNLYEFFHLGFVWFVFYFAASAYLNCKILKNVFAPYREEDNA